MIDHEIVRKLKVFVLSRGDKIFQEGSVSWSSYNSVLFSLGTFYKNVNGKNVYVIGDAACGVPYFKSLRHGLKDADNFILNPFVYDLYMKESAAIVMSVASSFSLGLTLTNMYLRGSRYSPFQWNSHDEKQVQIWMNTHVKGLDIDLINA